MYMLWWGGNLRGGGGSCGKVGRGGVSGRVNIGVVDV